MEGWTPVHQRKVGPSSGQFEWCELFRDLEVVVLAARSSDHKPLWVRLLNHRGRRNHQRVLSMKPSGIWMLNVEIALHGLDSRWAEWKPDPESAE
ncbi:hypothetical protein SLA2020_420230 [Shorea laevis]